MFKKSIIAAALVGSLSLGTSNIANATPVIGLTNLTFGAVTISLGEIDWNPPLNPGLDLVPTYGAFTVSPINTTGSFSTLGLTTGTVQDMSANAADANYVPIGVQPTPVDNFLNFAAQPGWLFSLTFLADGNVLGATSPYQLTQVGSNVSATISMNGTVCDTEGDGICDATDDVTLWTGIFSAQYTNTTIEELAALIIGGQTLDNNTWSATIEATAIPEPSNLALIGLGLMGLAGLRKRKQA